MFKKNTVPQRKPFNFSKEQIIADINVLSENEEQRNKLFLCLDEKPPQEKFSKLEEFLKDTNNLEDKSATLADLADEIDQVNKQIRVTIDSLKTQIHNVNLLDVN